MLRWRLVVCGAGLLFLSLGIGRSGQDGEAGSIVRKEEALTLVYLLDSAHRVRETGRDVWLDTEEGVKGFNYADYYYVLVTDPNSASTGSISVGSFAVNKRTADVWEIGYDSELRDKEMRRVQEWVRALHTIDKATCKKYGQLPIYLGLEK